MERRRAEPADAVSPEPALDVLRHARRPRRAGGEERRGRHGLGARAQRTVVEPGAPAGAAGEEPPGNRIVHGARKRHAPAQHADGDGEPGHAADEIARVIDGAEHPGIARLGSRTVIARLVVRHQAVPRKEPGDLPPQRVVDGELGVDDPGAFTPAG
jgi:hypothetical protein